MMRVIVLLICALGWSVNLRAHSSTSDSSSDQLITQKIAKGYSYYKIDSLKKLKKVKLSRLVGSLGFIIDRGRVGLTHKLIGTAQDIVSDTRNPSVMHVFVVTEVQGNNLIISEASGFQQSVTRSVFDIEAFVKIGNELAFFKDKNRKISKRVVAYAEQISDPVDAILHMDRYDEVMAAKTFFTSTRFNYFAKRWLASTLADLLVGDWTNDSYGKRRSEICSAYALSVLHAAQLAEYIAHDHQFQKELEEPLRKYRKSNHHYRKLLRDSMDQALRAYDHKQVRSGLPTFGSQINQFEKQYAKVAQKAEAQFLEDVAGKTKKQRKKIFATHHNRMREILGQKTKDKERFWTGLQSTLKIEKELERLQAKKIAHKKPLRKLLQKYIDKHEKELTDNLLIPLFSKRVMPSTLYEQMMIRYESAPIWID